MFQLVSIASQKLLPYVLPSAKSKRFPTIQTGTYSALGYTAFVALTFPLSFAAEHLINSGTMEVGTVRKVINSFGYFGCASGLFWLSSVECDIPQAAAALCISVGFYAGGYLGYAVSWSMPYGPMVTS